MSVRQCLHPSPCTPPALAAAPKRSVPVPDGIVAEVVINVMRSLLGIRLCVDWPVIRVPRGQQERRVHGHLAVGKAFPTGADARGRIEAFAESLMCVVPTDPGRAQNPDPFAR
jgi:hypothetical protein